MSASGVPIGIILDAVGPRYTTIIGSITFAAGLLSFAAAPALSDQLYYSGFFFLSLGGPAIITATVCAQNSGAFCPWCAKGIPVSFHDVWFRLALKLYYSGFFFLSLGGPAIITAIVCAHSERSCCLPLVCQGYSSEFG